LLWDPAEISLSKFTQNTGINDDRTKDNNFQNISIPQAGVKISKKECESYG
jgi:hypothetical protein